MTEFAGWEMPVQYSGINAEHAACRVAGALFDICHMGEIELRGSNVRDAANRIVSNDLSGVPDGAARYGFLLNERGGVIDDVITFVFDPLRAMVVTNAANTARDLEAIRERAPDGCAVIDVSERTGKIDLQGPRSREIIVSVIGDEAGALGRFRFAEVEWRGGPVVVSRTGYTGELGYELFTGPELTTELWDALLEAGGTEGLVPAGLGARDTLRLEAALPLYGHELDEKTTPYEAGLGRFVALDKEQNFVGKRALLEKSAGAPAKRLVGLEMLKRSVPRAGYDVTDGDRTVGRVTSGTMSPTLGRGIALAYVESGSAEAGRELGVVIRGRAVPCAVVETPFYRRRERP
jgi:aminomethyltransferase